MSSSRWFSWNGLAVVVVAVVVDANDPYLAYCAGRLVLRFFVNSSNPESSKKFYY